MYNEVTQLNRLALVDTHESINSNKRLFSKNLNSKIYLGCSWNWNIREIKLNPIAGKMAHTGSRIILFKWINSHMEVRANPKRMNEKLSEVYPPTPISIIFYLQFPIDVLWRNICT